MGLYRATISMLLFGQTMQNVMHFNDDSPGDPNPESTLCSELSTFWVANVRQLQQTALTYTGITVVRYDAPPNPAGFTLPLNTNGITSSTTPISPVFAHILRIRTGFSARQGRGRVYIPGSSMGLTGSGILTSQALSIWETQLGPIRTRFVGFGHTGRFSLGVRTRNPPAWRLCVELVPAIVPGVQRRRNIGVGI